MAKADRNDDRGRKIYDPACGSGSLLLQAKKHFDAHIVEEGFFSSTKKPASRLLRIHLLYIVR